jgi:asparagine synthetase B (glutamine-hydrolysing)
MAPADLFFMPFAPGLRPDQLTPEELITGVIDGFEPVVLPPPAEADPTLALGAVMRPALARPPCVIPFSGGRDSSAVLAVATYVARREGLPLPVPVTIEFAAEATFEREWQELVLRHLGLDDWVRLPFTSELDMVGPVVAPILRTYGATWPANAHMIVPVARQARGGSVVSGFGGDEVIGYWPWKDVADVMAGRRRPNRDDLNRVLRWLAPAWLKAEVYRRREYWIQLPWVRGPLQRQATLSLARDYCGPARLWGSRMRWMAGRRVWRVGERTLARLAADEGAEFSAPLLAPAFLSSLARAGGRWGWGDRTTTMRALFGGLLPEALISRRTKAEFSEPYFGEYTKRFAREWDGRAGVDPARVDVEVLRGMWLASHPHFLSSCLLQTAWLASQSPG